MENIDKKGTGRVAELVRRIYELQDAHANLKQDMLKFMLSRVPQISHRQTSSYFHNSNSFGMHGGTTRVTRHSDFDLTEEAQYSNILDSINQPIHICNSEGCIVYRNQAWHNFYGYTAAETIGKDLIELVILPRDARIAHDIIKQMLKGESWTGEFPVRNKKGERFVAFGSNKPIHDENGTVVGIICASAVMRPFQEIRQKPSIAAPRRTPQKAVSENIRSSLKDEWMIKDEFSRLWKGSEREGGCFDSRTGRFCWHWWLYNDFEPPKVESPPWVNTNSSVETNLVPWSSSIDEVDEIEWKDLTIRELIGTGSCGSVYHAMWNGSDVALKLFPKQEYSRDLILAFRHEVSLMKRLRHPNILLFMGAVTSPERLCIVTEFLCCGSLFHLLHRGTVRLDWRHRIHMAMDIARGMNYLHCCLPPIIHCDLTSSNIRVGKNWRVKIGDFGLCRIKHETYVTTKEGIGMPQWMAPEALLNGQANEKSDVYSYGVVLWELTTDKIPWDGLSSMQVIKAVVFMNQRLDIPKDVDPKWASLTERCLCSEPESRPTFQEILDELKDLQKKFAVQVKASTPPL